MKRLNIIGMLAVAALAFIGCSKEMDLREVKTSGTHTLSFVVQKDAETRTAVVEGDKVTSYVWTEKDDQYFHIFENGIEATEIEMSLSDDNKIATFKATFNDTDTTSFSYTAVYGSELSKAHNPLIINEQCPGLDTFDPAADVLVSAEPIVLEGNAAADKDTEFKFKLNRVVSVNKMTLKGLEAGAKISQVELSSDKPFSARYMLKDGSYTSNATKLVLDYSGLDAEVGEDGTFPVYFVSAPVEGATFAVRAITDGMVYNRDDFTSKLTLEVGKFRRFGINLDGYGEEISEGVEYALVESADQIADGGEYLFVSSKTDGNVAASAFNSSNYYVVTDVTVSEENVVAITTEQVVIFTLEESATTGKFYIKDSDGQYLYAQDKNNLYRAETKGDEAYLWTVTTEGITNVKFTERVIQYNSGSPRIACYKGTQTAISLYVNKATLVELADPELSYDVETLEVAWEDIESFEAPILNNPHDLTITYSSSNTDVATVDATTGEVSFVGGGETVITASSQKTDEYKAGSAQYTLKVTDVPVEYDFETVAELNALAATEGEYKGYLTDAVVTYVPDNKNAFIKDATGSILLYKTDHGFKQGQTYTGEVTVNAKLFNGTSELTSINVSFAGDGATVAPESVTIDELVGNIATYQNAYVKVDDLTVVSVSADGKTINVQNGEKTYVVYYNPGNAPCVTGDVISATGTICQYKGADQIKVWASGDLVITQEHQQAAHVITYSQPNEGGSFTVKVGDTTVENGAELDEGTVVTLNATVSEGYTFNGWTVTGATVSGNTETATFTVGTSDVTISALFIPNTGSSSEEVVFSELGYENGAAVESYTGDDFSIVFDKGTNANNGPKYYTTGTAVRLYGSNTFTVSSSTKTIVKIELTFSSGEGSNAITTDEPTYANGVWSGEAGAVVFTIGGTSGHRRLASVKVTFE